MLFWSLDRFSREGMSKTVGYLQRLNAANKAFHSYTEEFLSTDNELVRDVLIAVMSSLARQEAIKISERTKAALAAYKSRGGVLGNPKNLTDDARRKGSETMREKAARAHRDIVPLMTEMRRNGATLQSVADRLNLDGRVTMRGKPWSPTAVMRVLGRE